MGGASIIQFENAISSSLLDKKSSAVKISGSNLFLKDKKIQFVPIKPYASLREAREKFLENRSCFSLETLRNEIRTIYTQIS